MVGESRSDALQKPNESWPATPGIEPHRSAAPAALDTDIEPSWGREYGGYGRTPSVGNRAANSNVTNVATTVNVGGPNILITTQRQQVPFILRAVWFCLVGFWLSGVFITVGYLFCATLILAPVGFWFLNRVPQAQTLRMRNTEFHGTERDGITHLKEGRTRQLPWYYRAIYFPFGLIVGFFWLTAAWAISLPIITLPLSIWMIDRAPAVISLQRN